MTSPAEQLAEALRQSKEKLASVSRHLTKVGDEVSAHSPPSGQQLAELQAFLDTSVASSFAVLEQVPDQLGGCLEALRKKTDDLAAKAHEIKSKAARVSQEKKARLEERRQKLTPVARPPRKEPDPTLAPMLARELRERFRVDSAARGAALDEGPSFESWVRDTNLPRDSVKKGAAEAGSEEMEPAIEPLSSETSPEQEGRVKGLQTWLDETSMEQDFHDTSHLGETHSRDISEERQLFERWRRESGEDGDDK
ncbi:hypothetical protein Pan216_14940 [Planctomycetes bacterium Pan216]|uniref:Uncharacterized protein n=1 Tax=Kolteria novifilia TaxID=2527975 RepID=A0A518B113_9BACT|nr:hypothetical protein Pan216_14940 [Planctomycetes bacterium Pan216]